MGMYNYDTEPLDPEEEERKRQEAFAALAAQGGYSAPTEDRPPVDLPESVGFPTDTDKALAIVSEHGDAPASGALSALAEKSREPDPVQEQLRVASSALKAQNDPMADPESPPVPEALETPVDLAAGGGDKPEHSFQLDQPSLLGDAADPVEEQIRRAGASLYKPNEGPPSAHDSSVAAVDDIVREDAPRPGKGPDDVNRTPPANALPPAYGTGAGIPANADDAAKKVSTVPSNNAPPKAGSAQTLTQAQPEPEAKEKDWTAALAAQGEAQKQKILASLGDRPGVNGWALLADVLFNKGHSIPGIIGQAEQAGRAYDDDKRRVLIKEADPVQQQLQLMRLQGQQGTLDQRKAEAAAKAAKDEAAGQSEAEAKKASLALNRKYMTPEEVDAMENAPASTWRTVEARFRDRVRNDPDYQTAHAHGRELDAAGAEQGTIQGRAANLPTAVANTQALSAADANARVPAAIAANAGREGNVTPSEASEEDRKKAEEGRKVEAAKLAQNNAARADREEQRRIAEATTARETTERQQAGAFKTHFSEKMSGPLKMMAALDKLDAINDKYGGKDVPGKGLEGLQILRGGDASAWYQRAKAGDPEAVERARDGDQYAITALGLSIDQLYDKSGKTFGNKEIAMNAIRNAQNPSATPEQVQDSIETLRGILKDAIAGEGSARPDLTRQMFLEQGRDAGKWLPSQWAAQPAPQQPTAAAAPTSPLDSAINGLTGQTPEPPVAGSQGGYVAETTPGGIQISTDPTALAQYNGMPVPADPRGGGPPENLGASSAKPLGGLVDKQTAQAGKMPVVVQIMQRDGSIKTKNAMLSQREQDELSKNPKVVSIGAQ